MFEPKKFGKYLLIDKIAAGGLAELFQSKVTGSQGFEKLIAIKTILPHLAQENELISCFIDEAKLAALLNHQNIVQIYDFGDFEGTYYIAMQYLFGKDLRRVLDKAKEKDISIDLGYCLYIISLICSGLDYAHNLKDLQGTELKLIHRDVTPQNIIITYDGDVKIVDFGIAKAAARSTLTQIGTIKGKVAHMSPEQASGQSIDHRSDIFSTGIILYELVTGEKPFTGETMEVLAKVRDCKFKLAESIAPNLPEKVYSIIHRSLAKDPDKRYQSCREMQTDLEDCIHELTIWPTSRGLSKIMNSIYENDIVAEENVMRKTATITIGKANLTNLGSAVDYDRTVGEIIFEPGGTNEDTTQLLDIESHNSNDPNGSFTKVIQKHKGSKAPVLMYIAILILALASIISIIIFRPDTSIIKSQNKIFKTDKKDIANLNNNSSTVLSKSIVEKKQNKKKSGLNNISTIELKNIDTTLIKTGGPIYNSLIITKIIPTKSNVETILEIKKATKALDNNQYEKAITFFEKALINHPELSREITRFYAYNFRDKGIKLQNRDNKQAKIYLSKAIKIEPSNPHNHFQLGLLYIRLNDYSTAIEEYKRALNLKFISPTIYFNMGYAYAKLKDYKRAEEVFIKSINLNPPYKNEALFNLAVVQNLHGKNIAALKNLKRILKTNSDNKKAKLLLSKINKEIG